MYTFGKNKITAAFLLLLVKWNLPNCKHNCKYNRWLSVIYFYIWIIYGFLYVRNMDIFLKINVLSFWTVFLQRQIHCYLLKLVLLKKSLHSKVIYMDNELIKAKFTSRKLSLLSIFSETHFVFQWICRGRFKFVVIITQLCSLILA